MTNIFVQGGVVAVIGICTVFVVLAILWGTLELMRIVFTKGAKKPAAPVAKATPAPAPAPAPVQTAPAVQAADDEELIAVLTAAVAACLNQSSSQLRIRSYRRGDSAAPIWNRTARRDNLIG